MLAAAYEARAEAQAVQAQLKAQHGVDTVVTEIVRPEITLRLTGQRAQLSALCDAYDALDAMTLRLSALSQALDQGAGDGQAARAALQSERDTLAAQRTRLESLFGPDAHPAVQDLKALIGEMASALDAALAASGDTRLGACVKYAQLLCLCRLAAHQQGLAP